MGWGYIEGCAEGRMEAGGSTKMRMTFVVTDDNVVAVAIMCGWEGRTWDKKRDIAEAWAYLKVKGMIKF